MHNGPDAPVVRQRWLFTDLPFLPLGTNCILLNRVWDGADVRLYDVGMLPIGQNDYHQDARYTLPPHFKPNHICHDEWLSTGEPWPNDLPDTVYDDFWIPVCCGAVAHLISGGYQLGGPVVHYYGPRRSISGGYQWGGPVVHVTSYTRSTAGGFEVGGDVVHVVGYSSSTAGGLEVGGDVVHVVAFSHAPLGGYQWGGPVVHVTSYTRSTAGGFEVGGDVVHVVGYSSSTAGGFEVGGDVVHVVVAPHSIAGGYEWGGAVVRTIVYTDPTAGGFEVGGAAGDVYTPGDVLPGNSCADAGLAAFETLYTYSATSGVEYWWKIPVTAGVTYYFSTPDFAMTTMCLIYVGGSCPSPTPQDFTVPTLNCRQFDAQATGYFYCRWSLFFGTATIKWRLSTVGCL